MDTRLSCREARPLIWERAAGDLATEEARALDAHLEGCARCREEARAAERAFGLLSALDQPVAPRPDGWDRLYRRIRAPVAPLWRRVTAPALSSAAAMAAIFALAIGRIASLSPGPGEVVVRAHNSQPKPQPRVQIFAEDGTVVVSNSLGDNLTLVSPAVTGTIAKAETDTDRRDDAAIRDRDNRVRVGQPRAGPGSSRRVRRSEPVVFTYKPVVIPAGAVSRATPATPVVVKPKPPAEEPVVHYSVDYSGDIVGRPVSDTGTET